MNPPPEATSTEQAEKAEKKGTVTITVDGSEIQARPGELVIDAAERSGVYIPRFCYHPRMTPVGMCRMCLVSVEGPRGTSLQVSCMLPSAEGMKVDTQGHEVKKAQDGVLEFLLVNHPLDCPVCDKGGECPLQDQTLAFGPGETRFVEEKRHFEKPIEISPLVALDRERCILCDRCTRFSKEVAGDPLIHFQDRGNQTQINVFPDHPFASYFSGNTVQICPVGALTATPYRFKARPWDLEQVESTCTSCSFGCRVAVQSSNDELTRYLGIDAEPTNHGWMCDKGRFDFEAFNSPKRLRAPLMDNGAGRDVDGDVDGEAQAQATTEVSWGEALTAVAAAIKATDPSRIGVLGGSRLPNEDQYAWAKLAKSIIGTDNVDAQLGDGLPAEVVLGLPRATIDQACKAKAVVLLGPDLKEELPVLYLRLREAVTQHGLEVVEIAAQATSFTDLAKHHLGYRTGEAAAVVSALLGKTTGEGKTTADGKTTGEVAGVPADQLGAARALLAAAGDVVVIFGRQSLAESPQSVSDAVGLFAHHSNARFLPVLRRSNVFGALDMGLAPGILPGRVELNDGRRWFTQAWPNVPAAKGLDATGMLVAAAQGDVDVLILLGADPLTDFPDRELAAQALSQVKTVVAVDVLANASVRQAHIVLPATGYAERGGTTTNIEGRVTRLGQKVTAPGVAWPEWIIAVELAQRLGGDLGVESLEDLWDEIEQVAPTHHGLTREVLTHREYRDGVTVPFTDAMPTDAAAPTGRPDQTGRPDGVVPPQLTFSVAQAASLPPVDGYSVRLVCGRKLYDQGTLVQHSQHLAGLVAPQVLRVHPSTLAPLGIESGGRVRILNGRGSMVITVQADEQVPRGNAVLPFNITGDAGSGAATLIDATQPVTNVRVETP